MITEQNGPLNSSKEIQFLHCACAHHLIQKSKTTFVQCYNPTKPKAWPGTLHCEWLLYTWFANIARHGSHFSLSATVQHPSKMRCGVGVVSSILLQASSSASSCLAECLPPKHPLQYVVKYTPRSQQSKIHSKEGKKLREKKIFSAAT